jgi:hypothetical protein
MRARGRIDRKKHEVDIAERVLAGGVWAGVGHLDDAHVVDVAVDIYPWPLGTVVSSVEVQTGESESDDR